MRFASSNTDIGICVQYNDSDSFSVALSPSNMTAYLRDRSEQIIVRSVILKKIYS